MSNRLRVGKAAQEDTITTVEVSTTRIREVRSRGRVCTMASLSLIVAVRVAVVLSVRFATTRHQAVDLQRDLHLNHKATLLQMPRLDQKIPESQLVTFEEDEDDITHMVDKLMISRRSGGYLSD